jgi:hypothetical protein
LQIATLRLVAVHLVPNLRTFDLEAYQQALLHERAEQWSCVHGVCFVHGMLAVADSTGTLRCARWLMWAQ